LPALVSVRQDTQRVYDSLGVYRSFKALPVRAHGCRVGAVHPKVPGSSPGRAVKKSRACGDVSPFLFGPLTAFHEQLVQALQADAHRPRSECRSSSALYGEARVAGYQGGYTRITDFIGAW